MLSKHLIVSIVLILLSFNLGAQQMTLDPAGPVNAASYTPAGLPQSGIAQGGIFIIKGTNLVKPPTNPNAPCVNAPSLPLPTSLEGTTVTIRMGVNPISAFMIYVCGQLTDTDGYRFDQIAAILPSNTPVGTGTITVSYQGRSVTGPVKVVSSAPGIFTLSQSGRGPAVITDAITGAVNTVTNSFKPDQWITIWVTGLGPLPAPARDDIAPPAGNLNVPVEIYIGGQKLPADRINYFGRSPQYPGLDQLNGRIPPGLSGCSIPVMVKVGQMVSNSATISVGDNPRCGDSVSLSAAQLNAIQQNRNVSHAIIMLNRTDFKIESVDDKGVVSADTGTFDVAYGRFYQYHPAYAYRSQELVGPPALGQCLVMHNNTSMDQGLEDLVGVSRDPVPHTMLDAGPNIHLNGGALGQRQILPPYRQVWQNPPPANITIKYMNKSAENVHIFVDTLENFSADNRIPPGGERSATLPWTAIALFKQIKFNAGRNGQVLDSTTWKVRGTPQLLVVFDIDEDLILYEGMTTIPADTGFGGLRITSAYFKILGMLLNGKELDPDMKVDKPFLSPGSFTATTTATPQVGAINQTLQIPTAGLTWTQKDTVNIINRAQDYVVSWTGGDANKEHVVIYGQATGTSPVENGPTPVSTFLCSAPIGPGRFTIPAVILSQIPATKQKGGFLSFGVAPLNNQGNFTVTGIESGAFRYTINYLRSVTYQ